MAKSRKLPEGVSDWTMRIIDQLPDDFIIEGGNEGLEYIKVRGMIGKWGVVIQYDFNRDESMCHVRGTCIDEKSVEGTVPVDELNGEIIRAFLTSE